MPLFSAIGVKEYEIMGGICKVLAMLSSFWNDS